MLKSKLSLFRLGILLIMVMFVSIFTINYSHNGVTGFIWEKTEGSVRFYGENSADWAGTSVSDVGDVNGDGFDDFIVSSPGNNQLQATAGKTYLVFGSSELINNPEFMLSNANASFLGTQNNEWSGSVIEGIGDFNKDGYNDFAITSPQNNYGATNGGHTFVFYGRPTNQWSQDIPLTEANASFYGVVNERSGDSISGLGDVNGDGFDDFMIGAMWNGEHGNTAGKTYLILGGADWTLYTPMTDVNASYYGQTTNIYFGTTVCGGGDLNDDGFNDIVVGESFGNRVSIIYGKSTGWIQNVSSTFVDVTILGAPGDSLGRSSCDASDDINADGITDLVIGSEYNSQAFSTAGKIYLFYGRSLWQNIVLAESANASFYGTKDDENVGASISMAGDLNKDGYGDIITGTPFTDEKFISGGTIYLLFGGDIMPINASIDAVAVKLVGDEDNAQAGHSVSKAGDVNNDGVDDILIGSPGVNSSGVADLVYDLTEIVEIKITIVDETTTTKTEVRTTGNGGSIDTTTETTIITETVAELTRTETTTREITTTKTDISDAAGLPISFTIMFVAMATIVILKKRKSIR